MAGWGLSPWATSHEGCPESCLSPVSKASLGCWSHKFPGCLGLTLVIGLNFWLKNCLFFFFLSMLSFSLCFCKQHDFCFPVNMADVTDLGQAYLLSGNPRFLTPGKQTELGLPVPVSLTQPIGDSCNRSFKQQNRIKWKIRGCSHSET